MNRYELASELDETEYSDFDSVLRSIKKNAKENGLVVVS